MLCEVGEVDGCDCKRKKVEEDRRFGGEVDLPRNHGDAWMSL